MAQGTPDAAEPDVMDIFDESAGQSPVCRVCGSVVGGTDEYRRAHWAWHEAPNGA